MIKTLRISLPYFVAALLIMLLGYFPTVLEAAEPKVAGKTPHSTKTPGSATEMVKSPVTIGSEILFYVQERVFSFSPEDRAKKIIERVKKLSKDPLLSIDTITVEEGETTSDVVTGDIIIMSVTNKDAKSAGRSRQELANEYASLIRNAIQKNREAYSMKNLLIALGSTVVLVLLLFVIRWIFKKIAAVIYSWKGTRIPPVTFRSNEILSAHRVAIIVLRVIKFIRLILILTLIYFYVALVLSLLPWTRQFAPIVLGYILTPLSKVKDALLSYLPKSFFVLVIGLISFYVIRITKSFFTALDKERIHMPGFYKEWAEPTYKIVRLLILVFALVVVFPYLPGSDSAAFKGISIFLGVLFSLGSTSAVANMVSGVILTYMRAFKIGDRVQIADTIGDVMEKSLLITRIRTVKNTDVTIPNSMVLGSHVINYTSSAKEPGLILHTTVTIGYNVPWKVVHELLNGAALMTEHVIKEPEPFVLQKSLGDFAVSYELNAYTAQPAKMTKIYSELHKNILNLFNEAGVEIMSPHYRAVRDGNQIAIPKGSAKKGEQPASPDEGHVVDLSGPAAEDESLTEEDKKAP